jgi:hypothetical protein
MSQFQINQRVRSKCGFAGTVIKTQAIASHNRVLVKIDQNHTLLGRTDWQGKVHYYRPGGALIEMEAAEGYFAAMSPGEIYDFKTT